MMMRNEKVHEQDEQEEREILDLVRPMSLRPVCIGFIDAIHGQGAKKSAVAITANEVEMLVLSYLEDIANIEIGFLYGETGSWEIRWSVYAPGRINFFVESKLISEERVKELAKNAFQALDDLERSAKLACDEWKRELSARAIVGEVGASAELAAWDCDSQWTKFLPDWAGRDRADLREGHCQKE